MDKRYVVITADIIASKKQPEETRRIKERLPINTFQDILATDIEVLRGDEIQCVLEPLTADTETQPSDSRHPVNIGRFIRHLRYHLLPLKARVGIGIGGISTLDSAGNPVSKNPFELNGGAFHEARNALDYVRKTHKKKPYTHIIGEGVLAEDLAFINASLNLYDSILDGLTKSQFKKIMVYNEYGKLKEAAEKLNIGISSLQEAVANAGTKDLICFEQHLTAALTRLVLKRQ